MIEELFESPVWKEIVEKIYIETVASVSGRMTNGRFYHGSLTKDWSGNNSIFYAGYKKGLMDLWNHLHDFIDAKNKLEKAEKSESLSKLEPIVNPFMEESNEE